jgi:hypothetical protein
MCSPRANVRGCTWIINAHRRIVSVITLLGVRHPIIHRYRNGLQRVSRLIDAVAFRNSHSGPETQLRGAADTRPSFQPKKYAVKPTINGKAIETIPSRLNELYQELL